MTAAIFRVFPFWRWFKTAWVRRWEQSKQRITAQMLEYVHKCHAECQSNPHKRPASILEFYFLSEKEALCELSDDECVRHALNFVWGAVDSTRCTVCFAVAEATRNATLAAEMQAELDAQLSDCVPTLAQVMGGSVPKLHNWISEVLRLHPAFPFFPVVLEERVQLRSDPSIVLEKGSYVVAFPGAMHRDPDNWSNSETFDPSRFDNINAATLKGFQPFGGGTRRCVGERLGMFDVRFFVAALLKNFDFEAKSATFETSCPISKRIAGEYLVKAIERN
jgi:cytochrome P450